MSLVESGAIALFLVTTDMDKKKRIFSRAIVKGHKLLLSSRSCYSKIKNESEEVSSRTFYSKVDVGFHH